MHVLPWHGVMKPLIAAYLREARVYTLCAYPFEFSDRAMPSLSGVSLGKRACSVLKSPERWTPRGTANRHARTPRV